jgi:DNA-binding NarL/FixJ family response regulator
MERIRILLADDHALLRAGVAALLRMEEDFEVVGEVGTGEDAVTQAAILRPDLVVMDLAMPGIGGLEATRRIIALEAGIRVLILTVHAQEEYLLSVLEAGASGYVTKQSADDELREAIRTVARGQVFLYPSGARMLLQQFRSPVDESAGADPVKRLSGREREVLRRTAEGFSATEIGERLQISPKTVDTYRQRVMEKLKLSHRSELVRFALREGLLTTAD